MTANDTVEAIVADMRLIAAGMGGRTGEGLVALADRLQSAHDAEVGALRETNRRMNRRVQIAEAALPSYRKLIALPPDGDGVRLASGNFGRALLTWHCEQLSESLESAESRLREAERDAGRWREMIRGMAAEQLLAATDKFGSALDLVEAAKLAVTKLSAALATFEVDRAMEGEDG